MSWVHIRYGDMIDSLNHLHSEVVYNAVMNMAQNPNLTVGDLHKLLDIIEQEVTALVRVEEIFKGGSNEA